MRRWGQRCGVVVPALGGLLAWAGLPAGASDGSSVSVASAGEHRVQLAQAPGRSAPPGAASPQAQPGAPVADLKAIAGEWQGYLRSPDGTDVPFRLVIAENGSFEGVEGGPSGARYRGMLVARDGQFLMWLMARPGSGALRLNEEGGKRVLAGRITLILERLQRGSYDLRVEARGPAPPSSPASPTPPRATPPGAALSVDFRFPLDQARLADSFTVVVADVTSSQILASVAVTVNGAPVHDEKELGTRALALNVPVALREGTNVIVVSATDAQGAVRQEIRTVVHEPAAGIRVAYRVRGSATWVNLLYRTPDGRTEQDRVRLLPDVAWNLSFNARKGDSLEITAQSAEPGSVTCQIVVDGRPIAERSGSQNAPVTCQGLVTAP